MKTLLLAIGSSVTLAVVLSHADITYPYKTTPADNPLNTTDFTPPPNETVVFPYRIINGETQKVDGKWLAVSGTVAQVHPGEGLRVNGSIEGAGQDSDFFVVNLPITAGEGDILPPQGTVLLVKAAGTYTYSTAQGSTRTIRKYDFGIPCEAPQLTPEQLAAYQADILARVNAGKEKVLESDKAAAARNDDDGLERMADRYRTGDGVETNLITAKIYLMRAAADGSLTASNKLVEMNAAK